MHINIKHSIFFNKHYYFDKQELGKDIKPILDSEEIEKQNSKDELFDLYRAGRFERMLGLTPEETEWVPAQDAIRECFGLSTGGAFNVGNYCSINGVSFLDPQGNINNCNIDQQSGINIFTISTFCLSCDSIGSENYKIVLRYSVHRTIHQSLVPLLEFYSEDKLKYSYSSVEGTKIDLSQIGQRAISFEIPAKDIFAQNSGYYLIKFGASDLAKIEFPRCGLPLNGGIYSFSELRDFCNGLNGSPSAELLSFYNIIKRGELAMWLQDNEEEGEYKNRILELLGNINTEQRFKINDINSVLKILCNNDRPPISFPMSLYFSVTISKISSDNIVGKQNENDKKYYFVPWNSSTSGKLTAIIQPNKRCIGLDIDFTFKFRTDSMNLMDNVIHFNLKDIGQRDESDFDFRICVPPTQEMGKSNIYAIDSQGFKQETDSYVIVTGEQIPIPLSKSSSITMIGIYSLKQEPFYIAQTPLTQKQVQVLIDIAQSKGSKIDENTSLIRAIDNAKAHDGENDNLPASYLWLTDHELEVRRTLERLYPQYKFNMPLVEDLMIALGDGVNNKVKYPENKYNNLQVVSIGKPRHSTKLQILDMLGNIRTSAMNGSNGSLVAFGTTYYEPQQDLFISSGKCESYEIGYRPKMVKLISKETTKLCKEDTPNVDCSFEYGGDIVRPIDFATFL